MNNFKQTLGFRDPYLIYCLSVYIALVFLIIFANGGMFISTCANEAKIGFYSSHIDILECYGGADIGSYIRYFLSLDEHGLVDTIRKYHFGSWPPGFAYLQLLMYRIFGENIVLPMVILAGALWVLVLYQIRDFLFRILGLNFYISSLFPLIVLSFSFVNGFLLQDGLLMSESIATPLFGIFIINGFAMIYKMKCTSTMCVPCILALSILGAGLSFIRAQYDLVIVSMIAFSFVILMLSKRALCRDIFSVLVKGLALFVLCYACLTVPYKVFMVKSGKPFAMASVAPPYWASEANIRANSSAGFIADGGGHILCEVNPKQCDIFNSRKANGDSPTSAEYLKAAVLTALSNPVKLFFAKAPYFVESSLYNNNVDPNVIYSNVILFSVFIFAFIFYFRSCNICAILMNGYMLSIAAGSLGYGFLDHFEPRYFIPVKLFATLAIIFMTSDVFRARMKKNGKN